MYYNLGLFWMPIFIFENNLLLFIYFGSELMYHNACFCVRTNSALVITFCIVLQFSAGCKELIELGVDSVTSLSSLCVVYLDLIRLVYDDMLHSSPELLSDDWLAFHLTSCLIFAASSSAHQPRLWQLHDELHQFLSSIARDE